MSEIVREFLTLFMRSHVGRENAIRKRDIMPHLVAYNINDERTTRDLLSSMPLCSCADGWFTPEHKNIEKGRAEVAEFERFLTYGAGGPITARDRLNIIYKAYPMLRPEEKATQPGLFGAGEGA
jgi:hypothetical protein